ncbi:hypothetical protein N0V85_000806 [Neurospora sp. IMI 360204]|nr:hypothetical protein N0V85_000806 [Neurospora sp. IMI 360204]
MTPSAKTARLKDIILKWQEQAPDDKIIVFTQWIQIARIIGRVLQQENIDFLYLFGGMGPTDREDQIKAFQTNPKIKVLHSGQKKETFFTRILAKNTIDKRLLGMQEEKLKAINNAIQTNDNTQHKLSDEEVGSLFGRVRKQRDGTFIIESDYEDDGDDDHQDTTNGGEGSSRARRTCEGESGNDSDSDSDSDNDW